MCSVCAYDADDEGYDDTVILHCMYMHKKQSIHWA